MAKTTFHKWYCEFFSALTALILIVFTFYSAGAISDARLMGLDMPGYILFVMSDHYIQIFAFLPACLFVMTKIGSERQSFALIRCRSFFRYWLKNVLVGFFYAAALIFSQIIILILLKVIFYPVQPAALPNSADLLEYDIIRLFDSAFHNLAASVFALVGFFLAGMFFLSVIVNFLGLMFKKNMLALSVIFLFVMTNIGFRLELPNKYLYVLCPGNYFLLHHNLHAHSTPIILCTMAVVTALMLICVKTKWRFFEERTKKKKYTLPFSRIRWILYALLSGKKLTVFFLLICALSLLQAIFLSSSGMITVPDVLLYLFNGYGRGYFHAIEFLRLLIFNGLPLYFICVLSASSSMKNSAVVIRMKNPRSWIASCQWAALLFFAFYVIFSVVASLVSGLLFANGSNYYYMADILDYYHIPVRNVWILLILSSILRILELLAVQAVFLCLTAFFKNTTAAFFLSMLSYAGTVCNVPKYYPYGISSFLRQAEISGNIFYAFTVSFFILTTVYICAYAYLMGRGYQKILSQGRKA